MEGKSNHAHSQCPKAWLFLKDPYYPSVGSADKDSDGSGWPGAQVASHIGELCSPGDLPQRWGQASQVEGPGAAITADELTSIVAHSTFVLVLLTRREGAPCRPRREHNARLRDPPWRGVSCNAHPRGTSSQVPSLLACGPLADLCTAQCLCSTSS